MRSRPLRVAAGGVILAFAFFPHVSLFSMAQESKPEMQKIEKTIHVAIGLAKNKDFNLLYSVIANDSDYVEVSPGKRIVRGIEQFR